MEWSIGVEWSQILKGVPWISAAYPSSKHAKYMKFDVLNQCPGQISVQKRPLQI